MLRVAMTISSSALHARLVAHGYDPVHRSDSHCLYEHQGDRVMVPQAAELPTWVCQAIEWSLEPRLGRGWLTAVASSTSTASGGLADGPTGRLRLHLLMRADPDHSVWNAFVVEEPRILTSGETLAEVRARAADAASAWFVDAPVIVDWEFRYQVDVSAQTWIDHAAAEQGRVADRVADARRQLGLLGYAPDDVVELLTRSARSTSWVVGGDPTEGS